MFFFFFASSLPLAWPFYTLTMAHGSTAAWEAHVKDKLHRDGAQHAEDGGLKPNLLPRVWPAQLRWELLTA